MRTPWATVRFYLALGLIGGVYVVLILAMLFADVRHLVLHLINKNERDQVVDALTSDNIQYAVTLSLISCSVSAVLCLWVAVPLGYLLSRTQFRGREVVETIIDIPIVLPPLVIGLSLLILFQTPPGQWIEDQTATRTGFALTYLGIPALTAGMAWPFLRMLPRRSDALLYLPVVAAVTAIGLRVTPLGAWAEGWLQARFGTRVTFQVPSVILAQFAVCCAFAVRTMKVTFDQISPRTEQVALTLGCTRSQAFWSVSVPEAWRGLVSAGTIAWARALGEFGPILIFSGATRMRTEVLSTTVFLEFSVGKLEAAIAVSLLMVVVAVAVLLLMKGFGIRGGAV